MNRHKKQSKATSYFKIVNNPTIQWQILIVKYPPNIKGLLLNWRTKAIPKADANTPMKPSRIEPFLAENESPNTLVRI